MALNPRLTEWTGKTVWLVGASSGIGRATASALHAQGARVVVSARQASALASFVASHPGALALPMDVTDASAVRRAALTAAASPTGPHGLDCVVYCAGHYTAQRAQTMNLAEMVKHLDVNYLGALHVLDAVLPMLLAQPAHRRGHISLVGSVAGYRGLPNSLAYGPTKAALINLAETLHIDLQPLGVGVSIVNPGFVDTPLTTQNSFTMPALITPEQAAQAMLRGWAKGVFEIHYPRRFTWAMKLLEALPYSAFFAAMRRLPASPSNQHTHDAHRRTPAQP